MTMRWRLYLVCLGTAATIGGAALAADEPSGLHMGVTRPSSVTSVSQPGPSGSPINYLERQAAQTCKDRVARGDFSDTDSVNSLARQADVGTFTTAAQPLVDQINACLASTGYPLIRVYVMPDSVPSELY